MNLNDLEVFCAVAEQGSFSKVAKQYRVQKATISKQIRRLEESLGSKLMERTTRQQRLTEAGRTLYSKGKHLIAVSQQITEEVRGQSVEVSGNLKIAATLDLGALLAQKMLPEFLKQHPKLRVSMVLSYETNDILGEDIDIAIRINWRSQSSMIGVKLGELRRGLFAAKSYLKLIGNPEHPSELASHNIIGFKTDHRNEALWQLQKGRQKYDVSTSGSFCTSNFRANLGATVSGVGITMLPYDLFAKEIKEAGLVQILPDWSLPKAEILAVYPSKDLKPAKLTALLEALKGMEIF